MREMARALRRRYGRGIVLALVALFLIGIGYLVWGEGILMLETLFSREATPYLLPMLLLLYAFAMAVPFVPGVEIGIAALVLFGPAGAPFVWGATVSGLLIAFFVGRLVPERHLERLLTRFGLSERIRYLSPEANPELSETERLCAIFGDNGIARRFIAWRYLALGMILNVPGNVVLGGGGGIAMLSGASRGFRPMPFLLTIVAGVSPVPLLVILLGPEFLAE
ncbi:MAG: hypothetical protein ACPGID_05110 [Rubricella sp.]